MKRLVYGGIFLVMAVAMRAEERVIPKVRPVGSFEQSELERALFKEAAEGKKWPTREKFPPVRWDDTGLGEEARLVFIDYYLDGGAVAYVFKDKRGRYFVFCLESPTVYDSSEGGRIRIKPVLEFYVGASHPSKPGAMRVPAGSEADKFLLNVLAEAERRQPALPEPPRGGGWSELREVMMEETRTLTDAQMARLTTGIGGLWVLQDVTATQLKDLSGDALAETLSKKVNPLRKGKPCVVVISLPMRSADDVVRLEGYEAPGEFMFSQMSRQGSDFGRTTTWRFIYLPIAGVSSSSSGFSLRVNDATYRQPDLLPGYQFGNSSGHATGRRFE